MKTYVGIADAHGIESFIPEGSVNVMMLKMRANANIHRHALVYRITVDQSQENMINEFLQRQEFIKALRYIKKNIHNVEIEKHREKSWKLIPNPNIDPFG